MSADYYLRMASYADTMAQAMRIFASACAIDPSYPKAAEGERKLRETAYRGSAQDYERMARQYRAMAERATETQPAA